MKKSYQLVKLKVGTVRELKRLMPKPAETGLDGLLNTMIRITEEYRFVMKHAGWNTRFRYNKTAETNETGKHLSDFKRDAFTESFGA